MYSYYSNDGMFLSTTSRTYVYHRKKEVDMTCVLYCIQYKYENGRSVIHTLVTCSRAYVYFLNTTNVLLRVCVRGIGVFREAVIVALACSSHGNSAQGRCLCARIAALVQRCRLIDAAVRCQCFVPRGILGSFLVTIISFESS